MIEDQLEHDERLRLECLALAVASRSMTASHNETIRIAGEYEEFIREGKRS